ncbi:hypothetical protein HK098_007589 [Nowakowskiella sp. JEL0407]|nr:hypothetical protein HK098_007589 [Nowakowskiella sp. JEL0407]
MDSSETLLSFRAGRCSLANGKVSPDLRKGSVCIQLGDDDLLHFFWFERFDSGALNSTPEIDLVLFPGDAEFKNVNGRVNVLKFASGAQKEFFWMQDLSEEKDASNVQMVNDLINDVMSENEEMEDAEIDDTPIQTVLHTDAIDAQKSIQLSTLQNILAGLKAKPQRTDIELEDVVNIDTVSPMLSIPEFISSLAPFLPEGSSCSKEEVEDLIRSPQFAQSLQTLSMALRSGQLGPLLSQFGLSEISGSNEGVLGFVRAIQTHVEKSKSSGSAPK